MTHTHLTRQQKDFLAAIESGMATIEAYCSVYQTQNMSAPTLLKRVGRLARALGVQPPSAEEAEEAERLKRASEFVGRPAITTMLLDAYNKASTDSRGATAMIAATIALAKLHGHIHDKSDTTQNTAQTSDLLKKITKARQRIKKENEQNASQKSE